MLSVLLSVLLSILMSALVSALLSVVSVLLSVSSCSDRASKLFEVSTEAGSAKVTRLVRFAGSKAGKRGRARRGGRIGWG